MRSRKKVVQLSAGEFELNSVILLLSSKTAPIARVFEIWDVDEAEYVLRLRVDAHANCESNDKDTKVTTYAPGEGIVGKVWESGVPLVSDDLPTTKDKRITFFSATGLTTAIAMPLYVGESLKSVFVMLN